jgi:hypothetical protein
VRLAEILTESAISGNPQGIMTIGALHFDQKDGIGAVPDNRNVGYLGFACFMKPSMFARVADFRDFNMASNLKGIEAAIQDGKALASPFLDIAFDKDAAVIPRIMQHEGRTRCQAVRNLYGDVPILVHCFLSGMRARHISLAHIQHFRQEVYPQRSKTILAGALCAQQVWFLDSWQTIA